MGTFSELMAIINDDTATDAEKDDAIMDLSSFPYDENLVEFLSRTANDLSFNDMLRGSCGETLGWLFINNNRINYDVVKGLEGIAKTEILQLIKHSRSDWYEQYMYLKEIE